MCAEREPLTEESMKEVAIGAKPRIGEYSITRAVAEGKGVLEFTFFILRLVAQP
jgi:hypothetical protein